jgi:pyruvyl transferase EpsI
LAIRHTDTVIPRNLKLEERDTILDAKLDEFKQAALVVTDRLHGMVFAAITATPCIVLPNSYHKIKGLYDDWLTHLPYIRFASDITEVQRCINDMPSADNLRYDPSPIMEKFAPLAQLLAPPE